MKRRHFSTLLGGAATASAAWPAPSRAQPAAKSYRVGYLALLPGEDATLAKSVLERLNELGYREGQNMTFDFRSADGQSDRLPSLVMEMVRANPDVLITGFGTLTAKAAKAATTTVPIVFTSVGDPVGAGLVATLNRPGANVTGMASQASDFAGKQLQILEELVPGNQLVAVLMNPDTPFTALALQQLRIAANPGRHRLAVFEARTADEVKAKIEAALAQGAAGLLTLGDPLLLSLSRQIADLAAKGRLPTIYGSREFVAAGGLISFGIDRRQLNRRAADMVDKILRGAKPADLPVEQPTKFELVVNMKAAKALGLDIPPTVLARADEVIE
ncbi:MAG TPA: ABC transporter substrate-binding protein [Reyranella sp.]|jgi:putative ABC transport system substrate-binding protein|nr:ABC transporter substrate-binding protein [Reyranella sp.]